MNTEKWLNGKLIEGLFTFEEALKISNEIEGYSLPTLEEWNELIENSSFLFENGIGHFTFENDTILRLPTMGYRNGSFGATFNQGSIGYYWSSSISPRGINGSIALLGGAVLTTTTNSRNYNLSAYLIKE